MIPPELSVILRPTGRPGRLLEMEATLWTNCTLRPGFTLLPDDGELRLDRLELFTDLSDKDVRILLLFIPVYFISLSCRTTCLMLQVFSGVPQNTTPVLLRHCAEHVR